jgi:hypothetical protein
MLFACSKCFSRHPFEELSKSTQLCKVKKKKSKMAMENGIFFLLFFTVNGSEEIISIIIIFNPTTLIQCYKYNVCECEVHRKIYIL